MEPINNKKHFQIFESKEEISAFVNRDYETLMAVSGIEKARLPVVRTCSIIKVLIRLGNEEANSKVYPLAITAQQILDFYNERGNEKCFTLEEIELTLKQIAFTGIIYTQRTEPPAWRWCET